MEHVPAEVIVGVVVHFVRSSCNNCRRDTGRKTDRCNRSCGSGGDNGSIGMGRNIHRMAMLTVQKTST
eukprot:8658700-Pyramimonas_sp.AAC.1